MQIEIGEVSRLRIGDFLNQTIADTSCQRFRFAVAYMRLSGLDRLGASIDALLNRGGYVSGAIGIDDEVTSIEALNLLSSISSDSTIFYTVSDFIYHPKLYLMSGEKQAIAIVGSANLTGDGLFRNVEMATAVYLDFELSADFEAYKKYDAFVSELLNIVNSNVQLINETTIRKLATEGLIKSERQSKEPGMPAKSKKAAKRASEMASLFPPIRVPVAPPRRKLIKPPSMVKPPIGASSPTMGITGSFIMQLSPFDSSHRSGISGTPEVLIPQAAITFFPPLLSTNRKHPEAIFDVILNTNTGNERQTYRFWFYAPKTEWRLRMNHTTIELSIPGGGDLLVINKIAMGRDSDVTYEVTILPQTDPTFQAFLNMCTNEAQGKRWGMIDI